MKRTKITIILISFLILTIIGIYSLYYAYQIPETETQIIPLWEYQHLSVYDYTAQLKPNLIYNKTTLKPGEGPVYLRITESLDFSSTYTFQSNKQANATITYSAREYVQSTSWTKQLNTTTETTINTRGTSIGIPIDNIPSMTVNAIQSLAAQLDQEMGVYSSEYNATVTIRIQITAETTEGTINEQFNPTLTLTFKHGTAEGYIIDTQGLENTRTGAMTQENTIHNDWVINQRYESYALTLVALIGLVLSVWAYTKAKPTKLEKPEKYLEEIIEPYEDIIAEVTQEPTYKAPLTTMPMKSMEDLVKIADNLAKPILHIEKVGNNHVFYVIDETTRYEYTITAPTKAKEEKMYEEEEED
jgi:hypothetical protein